MSTAAPSPAVRAWLRGLSAPQLVEIVESACQRLPEFAAALEHARPEPDFAALRPALMPPQIPGAEWFFHGYDWYSEETYGYAEEVRARTDELRARAAGDPTPSLLPLFTDVIDTVVATLEQVDDSDGYIGQVAGELMGALQECAEACAGTMTDQAQVSLAEWLWRGGYEAENYGCGDAGVTEFAEALGPAGLARYRALVAATPPEDWRVERAAREFALLDKDPEAVIAAFGGRLETALAHWCVVLPLTRIGRPDLALDYARRGFARGPDGPWDHGYHELAGYLAGQADARGDGAEVLRIRQTAFESAPGRATYDPLREVAIGQSVWDSLRADVEGRLAARAPQQWLRVLLDQDRVDEAWEFARTWDEARRSGDWTRLLAARGRDHPADVLPHYQALIDHVLIATGRDRYETAGAWAVQLREFAEAAGERDWFRVYLARLWAGAQRRPACREIFTRLGLGL